MNNNYNSKNNFYEFSMGGDYLKEMDCNKSGEIFFNFPEENMFSDPFKFDENAPKMDFTDELFAFGSQQSDFESLNGFKMNDTPYEEGNSSESGSEKTKDKSKTKSETHLSHVDSNEEDSCKKIKTLIEKEDEEDNAEVASEAIEGDLNIFVEKLLNSTAVDYLKDQGIEVDDKTAQMLSVKKRKRKTKGQIQLLEAEYKQNPDWTKPFMQALGQKLGMSASSIYKWHWDQRHKNEKPCEEKAKKLRLSSMPKRA